MERSHPLKSEKGGFGKENLIGEVLNLKSRLVEADSCQSLLAGHWQPIATIDSRTRRELGGSALVAEREQKRIFGQSDGEM
jgi:hypothetical protein